MIARRGIPALSIVQPWAWLIIHGGKTVENRHWQHPPKYRGPVLIHASARMTLDHHYEARMFVQRQFGLDAARAIPELGRGLLLGGIIGMATLVDVLPVTSTPSNPWHMPGSLGFVLADAKPLPFRPCKGALNFWYGFTVRDGVVVPVEVEA